MKKHVFGRHFKRDANERKALFKNLLTSLVLEERIVTTEAKAKAIKADADKLVTKAKKGGVDAFRRLAPDVRFIAVAKLVNAIAPRFADRQGGYTRIIKLGRRVADNAPQVAMEWVDRPSDEERVKAQSSTAVVKKVKEENKTEVKEKVTIGKPVKDMKQVKNSAPKQMVTRQKKG
jgi:large subunit ribosomal protein L17